MIDFGFENETTELDNNGSTLTLIRVVRKGEIVKSYKQFKNRVKVSDPKHEMAEYLKHTDRIKDKKDLGILVIDKTDLTPCFIIEYPKFDVDGTYFVVSCWSEYIN